MITHFQSQRGSVLLVALLLTVAIALAVSSYFSLTLSSFKMADRSYHYNAAMNVAETGLEEGMWSINQLVAGNPAAFTSTYGWTATSGDASQKFNGTALGQNADDYVNVVIKNFAGAGSAPLLAARAVLSLPSGTPIEKWVEVKLSKRSKFSSGLVAKKGMVFKGVDEMVDSWDSTPSSGTTPITYNSDVAHASVRIASPELIAPNAHSVNIWGFVSVGSESVRSIVLGPDGLIGPFGTPAGTKDPTRISTDFSAPIDPVSQPTSSEIPLGYVTNNHPFDGTLAPLDKADPSTWTTYNVTSIDATNVALTTTGYVRLILSASEGTTAFSIGDGTGSLTIGPDSHVAIYTAGDITIGGSGIITSPAAGSTFIKGLASTLYIYGTGSTEGKQVIDIAGNGRLTAAVYAPNANITITGSRSTPNSDVYGSVVGNTVTIPGNTSFHYDEALGKDVLGSPYGIETWRELTTNADRAAWAGTLSF